MLPKASGPRVKDDRYFTPTLIADTMANILPTTFHPRYSLDLGCGVGAPLSMALIRRFPKLIAAGVDVQPISKPRGLAALYHDNVVEAFKNPHFTEWWWTQRYDLVIMNPPFEYGSEFIANGLNILQLEGYLVVLWRLNVLEGQDRFENLWGHFLRNCIHIAVLAKRPKFKPFKHADGTPYAIYIFSPNHIAGPSMSIVFPEKKNL